MADQRYVIVLGFPPLDAVVNKAWCNFTSDPRGLFVLSETKPGGSRLPEIAEFLHPDAFEVADRRPPPRPWYGRATFTAVKARIVWQFRMPYAVLTLLVGAGLAVVGVSAAPEPQEGWWPPRQS